MKATARHKWGSLTLLSIIIPMGLLVSFRLTGILQGPPELETFTAKTASWSMERPSYGVGVFGVTLPQNFYNDGVASISLNIDALDYLENGYPFLGGAHDYFMGSVIVNASVAEGFVESVVVKFSNLDEYAALNLNDADDFNMTNLRLLGFEDWNWIYGRGAYVETANVNKPKYVYLSILFYVWAFRDNNTLEHSMTLLAEVTYRSPSFRRKITMPLNLTIWTDAGNDFETAKTITAGNHSAFLSGGTPFPGRADVDDYYRIWVEQGQTIDVKMTPPPSRSPPGPDFDLYLYDSLGNLIAQSTQRGGYVEHISCCISGYCYIRVNCYGGHGIYSLSISKWDV